MLLKKFKVGPWGRSILIRFKFIFSMISICWMLFFPAVFVGFILRLVSRIRNITHVFNWSPEIHSEWRGLGHNPSCDPFCCGQMMEYTNCPFPDHLVNHWNYCRPGFSKGKVWVLECGSNKQGPTLSLQRWTEMKETTPNHTPNKW